MPRILTPLFITFFISFFTQFLCIRLLRKFSFCIDHGDTDKPQRFHTVPTPRTGGIGIFIAFAVGLALACGSFSLTKSLLVVASSLPAYISGFYDDVKSNISPGLRLSIMGAGAVIAMVYLDVILYDVSLFRLNIMAAVPFTLFAVIGMANAINIIDGFNGLAGGVSLIGFSFFALASNAHNDQFILALSLTAIASIAGFMVWNFPKGRIFLGDGGAYFIGFLFAVASVLLVRNNPGISPWYPIVVLAYPVFEVCFSIYRKKFKRGGSPFKPDRVHFHMLIHKRVSRNNPLTSLYLWSFTLVFNAIAFPFRANTPVLILIFLIFSLTYVYFYRGLVRFKKIRVSRFSGAKSKDELVRVRPDF